MLGQDAETLAAKGPSHSKTTSRVLSKCGRGLRPREFFRFAQ